MMNGQLDALLEQTERAMNSHPRPTGEISRTVHVGVDLGTAYTVLIVLDENYQPLAGTFRFAEVVRDGLVVDFIGAIDLLRELQSQI